LETSGITRDLEPVQTDRKRLEPAPREHTPNRGASKSDFSWEKLAAFRAPWDI